MKNELTNLKMSIKCIYLSLLCFATVSFGQSTPGFNPSIALSSNTNAIAQAQYGTSDGVSTYKYFEYKIPFHDTMLTGTITISSNSYCYSQGSPTNNLSKIAVNGTISTNNTLTLNSNLSEGIYYYTVKSVCTGNNPPSNQIICSTRLIAIKVIKEPNPTLTLNLSKFCKTNKNSTLYNGFIGLNVVGSYTNANKLYLKVTNTASNFSDEVLLTNLSTDGTLANNSVNSSFLHTNLIGSYTVSLIHKYLNIYNNQIQYTIPNNTYGWTNFNFSKNRNDCLNKSIPLLRE